MEYMENLTEYVEKQASLCQQHDVIDKELYARYGVKRGLRDENGQGVLTGLTNISQIIAFKDVDGQKVPCDGQLLYRGYDVQDRWETKKDGRQSVRSRCWDTTPVVLGF